jgi:hypothetical protein
MRLLASLLCLLGSFTAPAWAQAPRPLDDPELFSFPGTATHPASAPLAGAALATRWLGEEPFDNPAGARGRMLCVTPALVRLSRQDLRVDNRNFDEQPAFFDAGGLWLGLPLGGAGLALYAQQPALRLEDNAFARGEIGGPIEPAVVQSRTTAREWRVGLGASIPVSDLRLGAAVEWTGRDDEYRYFEQSGSPDAGERLATFNGSGLGFQAGARWHPGSATDGPLVVGLGGRFLPELELDGEQRIASPALTATTPIAVRRESGIEGGVSVDYRLGDAFHVLGGGGRATPRDWAFGDSATAYTATSEALTTWSLGGEYSDPEEAWRIRFGYGQERQDGAPEPRATLIGLSFGVTGSGLAAEIGVLRRSIDREARPRSFDDRVLVTLRIAL